MKILDVGCGANKYEGAVGLDNNPRTAADVIHDLGVVPYPFPDNEFDLIVSRHVIEHVPDVMAFVGELHRITRPGGRIRLVTPHYTNPDWATDPTHRNHFNSYTFNTFMPERAVFDFYTEIQLKPVKTHVSLLNLWRSLGIEFAVNLDQRAPKEVYVACPLTDALQFCEFACYIFIRQVTKPLKIYSLFENGFRQVTRV